MKSIDSELISRREDSRFFDLEDNQTLGKRSFANISLPYTESSFLGDRVGKFSLVNEVQDLIEKSKLQRKSRDLFKSRSKVFRLIFRKNGQPQVKSQ
jgi:hypothetical protein